MLFSSLSFLVFFLLFLVIVYFAVPQRFRTARNLILLAFSLLFYAYGGLRYLPLLLLSARLSWTGGQSSLHFSSFCSPI